MIIAPVESLLTGGVVCVGSVGQGQEYTDAEGYARNGQEPGVAGIEGHLLLGGRVWCNG